MTFGGKAIAVEVLSEDSLRNADQVFLSAGGGTSREWAPIAARHGAVVIDNSSAFRMDPAVPLVVPEINPDDAFAHQGIIAVPNCTTIVALMAVAPLHRAARLDRLIMSSYQSISGAGALAMAELEQQTRDWAGGRPLSIQHQKHQILFNLYPHIDSFTDNGYTKEEMKLLHEGRKILGHPSLRANATCVRVPVLRCHSVSLTAEFGRSITPEEARDVLSRAPGVELQDDPANFQYPMPLPQAGRDAVAVGRIRRDTSGGENSLCLWAVGDQLAKGAALNAVQIGELLIKGKA
jgi:aspartate-semialdehyde dehydrogenase